MSDLSNALVSYLEFESAAWPQTNEGSLATLTANDRAQAEAILTFTGECQSENDDLAAAAQSVRSAVKDRYPFLSDEALNALAWAWSYWSR